MIKLETAHIEEVRGIRKLDIAFQKGTFAISGPNGSGKSGVIDAIEFGLTGNISRLTGRGTRGLTGAEHGPHVDKTKFPDAAFVELRVFIPALKKSATITRKVSDSKKPKIVPPDRDVQAALAEIANHPEIMLSRREILRFILIEPTKRSAILLAMTNFGHPRPEIGGSNDASVIRSWKPPDFVEKTVRGHRRGATRTGGGYRALGG
jgi:recombinational DNA repair ATPase RecF